MGNVNAAAIWTPDEGDILDPEVWSGTMADSIMNGLGERMIKQETRAGARVSISSAVDVVRSGSASDPDIIFPLEVSTSYFYSHGNFIDGIELGGGILAITTAGLYLMTSSVICGFVADRSPLDMAIRVNNVDATVESLETSPNTFASKSLITMEYLVPGDTVALVAGVPESATTSTIPVLGAHLNVVAFYAT